MGFVSKVIDPEYMLNIEMDIHNPLNRDQTPLLSTVNSCDCISKGLEMLIHSLRKRIFMTMTTTVGPLQLK